MIASRGNASSFSFLIPVLKSAGRVEKRKKVGKEREKYNQINDLL